VVVVDLALIHSRDPEEGLSFFVGHTHHHHHHKEEKEEERIADQK